MRDVDDLYSVLGVSKSATQDEISYAYRQLAKKYHPDAGPQGSHDIFVKVNNAYETLGNVAKRKNHDEDVARHSSRGKSEADVQTEVSPFITKYNTVQFDQLSTEEIEEDILAFQSEVASLYDKGGISISDKVKVSDYFAVLVAEKCDKMMSSIIDALFEDPVILEKGFSNAESAVGIKSWAESILRDVLDRLSGLDLSKNIRNQIDNKSEYYRALIEAADKEIESDGGGCFIATEIYGSYSHPKVIVLRDFRDGCLQKTVLGNLFVHLYYRVSERLLRTPLKFALANGVTRAILDSIVYLVRTGK